MNLKKQLELLLEKYDINASQLSRKTGVPRQTIANWLSAQKPKNVDQLKLVADHFGITIDELLYGELQNKKPSLEELILDKRFEIKIIREL